MAVVVPVAVCAAAGMSDDSRHTGELQLACQREGIETIAYMHARFNEYHVGLAQPRFDRYLIWAGFFGMHCMS